MTARVLILSGGVAHDFADSSAALAGILEDEGASVCISEDMDASLAEVAAFDVLVLNALRWRMADVERYAPLRDRWGYRTTPAMRDALFDHLSRGRGLLAMHTASICFDDWPEWGTVIGAAWQWDRSRHDPPGPAWIEPDEGHPIVEGLAPFETVDEIYTRLRLAPDARPLAWATPEGTGERHPVLFAQDYRGGRVVYDALGHDRRAITAPGHARLIAQAFHWVAGRPRDIGQEQHHA